MDKPILYQPFQPRHSGYIVLSELEGAITYRIPSEAPESILYPEGKWYCPNPECVVRDVTVYCKLYGEKVPRMKCPACRHALQFRHWLRHETLVPYKEEAGPA